MYHANLDDVVFWLKVIAFILTVNTVHRLIFQTPKTPKVVSPDNNSHDAHRESWKPFPGYDGTQEP